MLQKGGRRTFITGQQGLKMERLVKYASQCPQQQEFINTHEKKNYLKYRIAWYYQVWQVVKPLAKLDLFHVYKARVTFTCLFIYGIVWLFTQGWFHKISGPARGGNINQTLSFLQLAPPCLQLEDQYCGDLLFADSSCENVWCESDG